MEPQTATLTHKVRNPQKLDNWLDIWETKVTANFNGNNNDERDDRSEKIIITPSKDWQIPTKNLIESIDDDSKEISFPGTVKADKIIDLPTNHILITDGNGKIVKDTEHFVIPADNRSQTLFLNEQGDWTDVGYNLNIENDPDVQSSSASYSYNLKLTQNDNKNKKDIINIQLKNPIYSVFGKKNNNDETPSLSLSIKNIMNVDIAKKAGISTSKLDLNAQTAINNTIITDEGTPSVNKNNKFKVWATNENGEPSWQDSTAQFNTKLFGAIISSNTPENELTKNSWDYNHCGIWIEI